jgi:hypothetical protein
MSLNDRVVLCRDLTKKECPWLDKDLKKGDVIYRFPRTSHQCVNTENGLACSYEHGKHPFFEIPFDAIDHVGSDA